MKRILVLAGAALLAGSALGGTDVDVVITGEVAFNGIGAPPLSGVNPGDSVTISFTVNSADFEDGVPGDTRGYVIDQSSFVLEFESKVVQGLLDPFPGGQTPYFTIVEGFPVSDGFFVSTSPFSPGGVPLEQEPYQANFSVSYTGATLDSLDILDVLGTYDFTGLTVFGLNLWAVSPDNVVLDMNFEQLTITVRSPCVADLDGCGVVDAADLAILLGAWGFNPGHVADINGDDFVNATDLAIVLGMWGPC